MLLFGTSANPPTGEGGHLGIVRWAAERPDVDEVWVLPVFKHAYEEKSEMPSFEHRFRMAELAFSGLERVRVLDVERVVAAAHPGMRIGTIDVVRHLTSAWPDARFGLLLGADTYNDLLAHRWKESEALLAMVRLIAVPRPGVPSDLEGLITEDVSSTRCRRSTDRTYLKRALVPAVLEYIEENQLYALSGHKADVSDC